MSDWVLRTDLTDVTLVNEDTEDFTGETLVEAVIGVLTIEVDKMANQVTDMEVDKETNMVAEIPHEDWYDSGD